MKRDVANIKKKTVEKKRNIKFYYSYTIDMQGSRYELKLVYNEKDGTLDGIIYEKETHAILMEVLRNFAKYDLPLTTMEYRDRIPETRELKIMFNKAGGNASKNAISNKISIPSRWVSEMGITKTRRTVKVTYDGKRIIIEKK